jgi:hypothetical protein
MHCPRCATDCLAGQKFCMSCGHEMSVAQAPSFPSDISSFDGFAPPSASTFVATHLPVATPTPPPPPLIAADSTPTGEIRIVEQTIPQSASADLWDPSRSTEPVADYVAPNYAPQTQAMPAAQVHREEPSVGGGALAMLAGLAGIATILGSFLTQVNIKSDAPDSENVLGAFKLNDFRGTNLQVAFLTAGIVLLIGAAMTASGKRFGRGLLGGAGLALVPAVACVFGLSRDTMDRADVAVTRVNAEGLGGSYFDAQPGIGFYVLLAGALLGLFAFLASFARANNERTHGLNSALCGIGAVASVIAGIGQLIPENGAGLGDNFSDDLGNKAFVYGRLAMAVLVAGCGVVGFMRRSRWGIGLALGGLALYAWQWVSSWRGWGDLPTPPAFENPGGDLQPHMLTTVGIVLMVIAGLVALGIGGRQSNELA